MPRSTSANAFKTEALVLRRTNYGEADRILNLITPSGKLSVLAKGVRKEKSKLAGGIEMFSLSELMVRPGRGELGVVTSAKMLVHYRTLVQDLSRMELAAEILRRVNRLAEGAEGPEYFNIAKESLSALNDGASEVVVKAWAWLRMLAASGEELNLYRDVDGAKLNAELLYEWDAAEKAFRGSGNGEYGVSEIKLMRLMATSPLVLVRRVKEVDAYAGKVLQIVENML